MFGLTSDLEIAQCSASPVWRVEATVGALSPGGGAAGEVWQSLVAFPTGLASWVAQGIAHDAAASEDGILRLFLSHSDGRVAVQWCPGSDHASASFTAPAVSTIATFAPTGTPYTPKPALVQEGGRWHVYYTLPDGNIYHRVSNDDGATWSSVGTVYGGGDAVGDLFALHLPADNLHLVQFSIWTSGVRMKGAARAGSGAWQVWSTHASATGWLPAGLAAIGNPLTADTVRQFWTATTSPPRRHYLATVDCVIDATGALTSRSTDPAILHTVAGESPVRGVRHAVGRCLGGLWYTTQLTGASRVYLGAGRVDVGDSTTAATLGEALPVALTTLPNTPLEGCTIPIDRGNRSLLVGLGMAQRSAHRTIAASSEVDAVIAYRHTVRRTRGGALTLELRRSSALAYTQPGDVLWLTRTCRKGDHAGSVTLGFVVQRVEIASDGLRIHALDALGALAESLTGLHIAAGTIDDIQALRTLCAWGGGMGGVESDIALASGDDAPDFYWRAGERGNVALLRYLRRLAVQVRSRVAGMGAYPHLRIDDDAPATPYLYGGAGHPLIRSVQIADSTAHTLLSVRGVAIRNQPEQGEDWALAGAGDALLPGRCGAVLALEDRHLEGAEITDIAAALAERIGSAITCRIETQANLALEVEDRIEVDGGVHRVEAIEERWQQGRLIQHVELCSE